jgi:hypothetical protein
LKTKTKHNSFYFIQLVFFIFIIFNFSKIKAETDFQFSSELAFKHEMTISSGELESYSLQENSEVKLLIGILDGKTFFSEAKNLSNDQIKENFLDKNKLLDGINNQSNRHILGFNKTTLANEIKIEINYELSKDNLKWYETNIYILNKTSSIFASLQFPETTSTSQKEELKKGMINFKLIESTSPSKKTTYIFNHLKQKISNLLNQFNETMITTAYAADSSAKINACGKDTYIIKGQFTTKPGSALFNFPQIIHDIKEETIKQSEILEKNPKAKVDDTKLNCLMDYYQRAKQNATTYWTQRATSEECIVNEKILDSAVGKCSDSTLKEMKKSFAYVGKLDSDFETFLKGNSTEKLVCNKPVSTDMEELEAFKKLHADFKQSFCCSSGNGVADDKGPLYLVMESENDSFKTLSTQTKAELCIKKTIDNDKQSFLSAEGLGDCAQNMLEGLGKIIKDTIKAVASLFDIETLKALGQFASNLPGSAKELLNTIGQQLAAKLASVTECMSPYESKQYMCRMVPGIATTLLGPGMLKSFATAIVDKAGKTALAEVIMKAASENKQFQKLKSVAEKTGNATKKVTKYVSSVRIIKPSLAVLGKVSKVLGKDISTPLKDMVLKKSKSMAAKAAEKVEGAAKKVFSKEPPIDEKALAEYGMDRMRSEALDHSIHVDTPKPTIEIPKAAKASEEITPVTPTTLKYDGPKEPYKMGEVKVGEYKIENPIDPKPVVPTQTSLTVAKKVESEVVEIVPSKKPVTTKTSVEPHKGETIPGDRSNPSYEFEAGEKVIVPNGNGKYTSGRITDVVSDADGSTSYKIAFKNANGDAVATISKDGLHKEYAEFYKKAEAPAATPTKSKQTKTQESSDVIDIEPKKELKAIEEKKPSVIQDQSALPNGVVENPKLGFSKVEVEPTSPAPTKPLKLNAPEEKPKLTFAEKKSEPVKVPVKEELSPVQVQSSATNTVRSLNEKEGLTKRMTDRQKADAARELGITNDNRIAEMDFKPAFMQKDVEKVFQKVLPEGSKVDVKELRKMMSFAPESGYNLELAQAEKFVKTIEEAGGVARLNTAGLNAQEMRILNHYLERVPEYAKYKNPAIKTAIKSLDVTAEAKNASLVEKVNSYKSAMAKKTESEAAKIKQELLDQASKLDDAERLKLANSLRKKPFSPEQEAKLIEAHEVGMKDGRGFGTYTPDDILKKNRLMKEAGIESAEERRIFMETGITGTSPINHTQRLKSGKLIGDFQGTGNIDKLQAGLAEGRKFYGEFLNESSPRFYTADRNGFLNLTAANESGLTAKETAKQFKKSFAANPETADLNYKSAIGSMNNLVSEYEASLKKLKSGQLPNYTEYKIYKAKELRNQLIEDYFEKKYPDKYKELDWDKMDRREQDLLIKYRQELKEAREKAKKLKLPIENETSY